MTKEMKDYLHKLAGVSYAVEKIISPKETITLYEFKK